MIDKRYKNIDLTRDNIMSEGKTPIVTKQLPKNLLGSKSANRVKLPASVVAVQQRQYPFMRNSGRHIIPDKVLLGERSKKNNELRVLGGTTYREELEHDYYTTCERCSIKLYKGINRHQGYTLCGECDQELDEEVRYMNILQGG